MPEDQATLVFVYGTLRAGASNHFRLEGAKLRGEGWVLGRLYRIDWYPGLLLDEEGIPVRGEIYEVEREMLRKLDSFEGGEYERLKHRVYFKGGDEVEAWLYEYREVVEEGSELVPADWVQHGEGMKVIPPSSTFSVATFLLLPVTLALGIFSLGAGEGGVSRLGWVIGGFLPLLPFLTGRWARRRREKLVEGAEVCAAVAFIAFWLLLLIRYLPAAFEAFPN